MRKSREGGVVRDAAVLFNMIGIGPDQRRRVLGVSLCALRGRSALARLPGDPSIARGMRGVAYIVSDDHPGTRRRAQGRPRRRRLAALSVPSGSKRHPSRPQPRHPKGHRQGACAGSGTPPTARPPRPQLRPSRLTRADALTGPPQARGWARYVDGAIGSTRQIGLRPIDRAMIVNERASLERAVELRLERNTQRPCAGSHCACTAKLTVLTLQSLEAIPLERSSSPSRKPWSRSACRTHLRSVSEKPVQPIFESY